VGQSDEHESPREDRCGASGAKRVDIAEWGDHPSFSEFGQNFVFCDAEAEHLSVKLSREDASAVVATDSATALAGHGLARRGWIDVSVSPTMGPERWQEIRNGCVLPTRWWRQSSWPLRLQLLGALLHRGSLIGREPWRSSWRTASSQQSSLPSCSTSSRRMCASRLTSDAIAVELCAGPLCYRGPIRGSCRDVGPLD
jgi:hypothetical protein